MKLSTVNERIENATSRIEKKEATLVKKSDLLVKKIKKIEKAGYEYKETVTSRLAFDKGDNEVAWLCFDVESLRDDIKRLGREITELKEKLVEYSTQKEEVLKEERFYLKEVPEIFKEFERGLVKDFNDCDFSIRSRTLEIKRSCEYKEYIKQTSKYGRNLILKSEEEIIKDNEDYVRSLIMGLCKRVLHITGEITDFFSLRLDNSAYGTVLNGVVVGKTGKCEVKSILAGGYNEDIIVNEKHGQCRHIRVLANEVN